MLEWQVERRKKLTPEEKSEMEMMKRMFPNHPNTIMTQLMGLPERKTEISDEKKEIAYEMLYQLALTHLRSQGIDVTNMKPLEVAQQFCDHCNLLMQSQMPTTPQAKDRTKSSF